MAVKFSTQRYAVRIVYNIVEIIRDIYLPRSDIWRIATYTSGGGGARVYLHIIVITLWRCLMLNIIPTSSLEIDDYR